jgi:hypothetical protein
MTTWPILPAATITEVRGPLIVAACAEADKSQDDSVVTAFFPKPVVPEPAPATRALSSEKRIERAKTIIHEATSGLPGLATEEMAEILIGNRYISFTSVESLPKIARNLYEAAAEVSGTSLAELTRAVRMLENKMVVWGREQGRAEREVPDGNGGAFVID